jgi:predicted TIM-barrel fold metal-dependent hydrolase
VAAMTCENILLELSTLLPHQIMLVLKHVKATRIMIGSDLPENVDTELTKIMNLEVSDEIKQDILWNTACQVFGEGYRER